MMGCVVRHLARESGRATRSIGSTPRPRRRTRVVGIFPNDAAALRLITPVCVEQHDEWIAAERHYLSEQSMAQLTGTTTEIVPEACPATLKAHRQCVEDAAVCVTPLIGT